MIINLNEGNRFTTTAAAATNGTNPPTPYYYYYYYLRVFFLTPTTPISTDSDPIEILFLSFYINASHDFFIRTKSSY